MESSQLSRQPLPHNIELTDIENFDYEDLHTNLSSEAPIFHSAVCGALAKHYSYSEVGILFMEKFVLQIRCCFLGNMAKLICCPNFLPCFHVSTHFLLLSYVNFLGSLEVSIWWPRHQSEDIPSVHSVSGRRNNLRVFSIFYQVMSAVQYVSRPKTRALVPTLNSVFSTLHHVDSSFTKFLNVHGLAVRLAGNFFYS